MEETSSNATLEHVVEVQGPARWQVYHRLKELGLACWCKPYQPLRVQICSPAAAIQLWSAIRQMTLPRQELARWLEVCWQSPCSSLDGP